MVTSVSSADSREEPSFQVKPSIDGTHKKAPKPVKNYPLEGANEQPSHNSIIIYYIANLRLKVTDMLIW